MNFCGTIANTMIYSIIGGILASIAFTAFLYLIQQFRYWYYLYRKFNNRKFNSYYKRNPDKIVQTLTCTVKGNIIEFSGENVTEEEPSENTKFEGELLMNPINLKMGEGFQTHTDNIEAFGSLKAIIKGRNILVEAPYVAVVKNTYENIEGTIQHQAFIWRPV